MLYLETHDLYHRLAYTRCAIAMKRKIAPRLQLGVLVSAVLIILFATYRSVGDTTKRPHWWSSSNRYNRTFNGDPYHGDPAYLERAPAYIKSILHPLDHSFDRLACPSPEHDRYDYLLHQADTDARPRYFFALDLTSSTKILPRLLGSIIEAVKILGPEHCALSVVEGRSEDGTYEILKALEANLTDIHLQYYLSTSDLDPMQGPKLHEADGPYRIETLARLRNQALEPLTEHPDQFQEDTMVIFVNDVAICMEDILELIHQKELQKAHQVCAMDWSKVGNGGPTFYDVWVARDMNGESFFQIPLNGSWDMAWKLFWSNPRTNEDYYHHRPFQVFSCWNGATVFTAKPFTDNLVRFRAPGPEECYQGEPMLLAKDLWHSGYGRIAVIPSISLEYSTKGARAIKEMKGYTSKWVSWAGEKESIIQWKSDPPERVRCVRNWADQVWIPWNEALGEQYD